MVSDWGFEKMAEGVQGADVASIDQILEMISTQQEPEQVRNRGSILAFFMAKDDNMILLMSGLIHSIQQRPQIWRHNPYLNDLFGL